MRRIAIVLGSRSDLSQCLKGLEYLRGAREGRLVDHPEIRISSAHRLTNETLRWLGECSRAERPPDVIIAGAGWAAVLPGLCDAHLRHDLNDTRIVVLGVAFEDPENERHTQAAELSLTDVPSSQLVHSDEQGLYRGDEGFLRACQFAVEGALPAIRPADRSRSPETLSLEEAIAAAKPK